MIFGAFLTGLQMGEKRATRGELKPDTLVVHDTLTITTAAPVETTLITRYKTRVAVVRDTLRDTAFYPQKDSVFVELFRVQKHYIYNNAEAWVSGIDPALDSLRVINKRTEITRPVVVQSPRRWGVGITAGYGATPRGLQPYVGVGVTYNLFTF